MSNQQPNLESLFESWSTEFSSKISRVNDLIGGSHRPSIGNYREVLFRNFLKRFLPKDWIISTGFVIGDNGQVSRQQDVIVWKSIGTLPYLSEGEFAIVPQNAVMALIEVKSNLGRRELRSALECLHSEMFHNWKLGSKRNPWGNDNSTYLPHVPFRGIFAFNKPKTEPIQMIFEEITKFYSDYYPPEHCYDIIVKHIDNLRYIHLIDCVCVLDNIVIEQEQLSGKRNNSNCSEPCFMAWQFKKSENSKALAWFLFYLYREVNRKIVSPEVGKNIDLSKGVKAKPFICRFDSMKSFKITRPVGLSTEDYYIANPSFWD